MKPIFLLQVQDNIKSFRFLVCLGTLLIFFIANGVIYTFKNETLHKEVGLIQKDVSDRYDRVKTLNAAVDNEYRLSMLPRGTEFIAEGGLFWFNDTAYINPSSGEGIPLFTKRITANNWVDRFELVDWIFIVRVVLSFLCIVLAYNSVSADLERGTYHQIFVNSVSHFHFLMAKFLAHFASLFVSIILGSLVSMIILSANHVLEINSQLFRSYLLFLLNASFYMAIFLFTSIGVSAWIRNSSSSLVLMTLFWALVIIIIPQSSYLIGVHTVQIDGTWRNQDRGLVDQFQENLTKRGISLRGETDGLVDNYQVEKEYANSMANLEKERKRLRRQVINQQVRQYKTTANLNLLSPGYAFQYATEASIGVGIFRYVDFVDQVWRYVETLREYLKTRDAADPQSPHVAYLSKFMSEKSLDSQSLPKFRERLTSLNEGITAGMVPILFLLAETLGAFLFAMFKLNGLRFTR